MSLGRDKIIERSVDSISKIYAIVIALALTQSVQALVVKDATGSAELSLATLLTGAPAFVAFLFTLVPFWHGMNRHLDRCYLEKTSGVAQGALLFDFAVFFIEASLLFIAGWSLRSGLVSFYCLGLVLLIDMIWGSISHQIHFPGKKSHVRKWAGINIAAGFVAFLIVIFRFEQKPLGLMAVAIVRTIVDYWLCWDFYFPGQDNEAKPEVTGSTPINIDRAGLATHAMHEEQKEHL